VQGWSADEVTDDNDDNTYQSFECTFRTRVHLVNLKTGKVVGAPTLAGAFHCGGRAQGVGSALRRWSRLATFLTAIC
jgi:hypothetical protein